MENLLRQVDCRITLPFWNVPLHSKTLYKRSPGYHMWDEHGGFGSTKTHVRNGFCIENGPFKWPQYKLPKFFVRKLKNKDRMKICFKQPRPVACNHILKHTFRSQCMTRSINQKENVSTYEQTYQLVHHKLLTFDKFVSFVLSDCHGSVHDNMGMYDTAICFEVDLNVSK